MTATKTNKNDCRIIFMGTPLFAVPSLDILLKNNYNIAAVVTNPDKPAGRGQKLQESEIKTYAASHGLNIIQPDSLKDPSFAEKIRSLNPHIIIVVAFKILPESVWNIPPLGTFNLHASLLPQYRGAAPINHAIINGEKKTGVTTFLIDKSVDTGNILLKKEIEISDNDNAGTLHDKLMDTGALLVLETVEELISGALTATEQPSMYTVLKTAPKIHKEYCSVNWNSEAVQIHNFVRGLSPYPCAYTELQSGLDVIHIKIYETEIEECTHSHTSPELLTDGKTYLKIAVRGGFIHLLSVQLQGKKRMHITDFLRGFKNISSYSIKYQ